MIKKIWIVLALFLCMLPVSAMTAEADNEIIENDETGIPDKELYKKILGCLKKKENETFTRQEAEFLRSVYLGYGNAIGTFKGVGCLKNLEEFECSGISSRDLEEIATELPQLKKLVVDGYDEADDSAALPPVEERKQEIDSIACLQNMVNLEYLDVSDNNLSSLEGIGGLAGLKTLDAGKNQITDVKQLENLLNLRKLKLYENQIKNLNEIKRLTKLTNLDLSDNQITDLNGIKNLTQLSCLSLSGNKIKNVKGVKNLKNLKEIYLNDNQLKTLGEIKKLEKLKILCVVGNKINSIKGIKNLKNLKILYLSENRIANADGVKYLKKLEELVLSRNRLKKLPDLKKLKKLKILDASDNELKKLPDLKWMDAYRLDLNWNYLTEEEIKNKLPKGLQTKYRWESQKTNIKIQYLSPKKKTKITKDTKKIIGKITPAEITHYPPGIYLLLPDGKMAGWDGEMESMPKIRVDKNGRFRIKGLDLKKYAGKEVELRINIDYDIGDFVIDRFIVQE